MSKQYTTALYALVVSGMFAATNTIFAIKGLSPRPRSAGSYSEVRMGDDLAKSEGDASQFNQPLTPALQSAVAGAPILRVTPPSTADGQGSPNLGSGSQLPVPIASAGTISPASSKNSSVSFCVESLSPDIEEQLGVRVWPSSDATEALVDSETPVDDSRMSVVDSQKAEQSKTEEQKRAVSQSVTTKWTKQRFVISASVVIVAAAAIYAYKNRRVITRRARSMRDSVTAWCKKQGILQPGSACEQPAEQTEVTATAH